MRVAGAANAAMWVFVLAAIIYLFSSAGGQ